MRQQIASHVRGLIASGHLEPGARLPSTQELARHWSAQTTTVQSAMARLVKEGLLERAPRVGTFVRQQRPVLEQVAVYLPENNWDDPHFAFTQAICAALTRGLKQRGMALTVRANPATGGGRDRPWPALVEAARRREFQALVAMNASPQQVAWLRRLAVPTAFLCEVPLPNAVQFDYAQFCAEALDALEAQGCRSVGLIASIELYEPDQPGRVLKPFHRNFRQAAEARGMEWREEWIKAFEHWHPFRGEVLGYDYFRELWQAPDRPAGLVVFPDIVARGVLMGVASQQVSVPQDLKLVLHRNREIGLVCPVPATFLDVSVAEVARALIGMVERQFRGESVEPAILRYTVDGSQVTGRGEKAYAAEGGER